MNTSLLIKKCYDAFEYPLIHKLHILKITHQIQENCKNEHKNYTTTNIRCIPISNFQKAEIVLNLEIISKHLFLKSKKTETFSYLSSIRQPKYYKREQKLQQFLQLIIINSLRLKKPSTLFKPLYQSLSNFVFRVLQSQHNNCLPAQLIQYTSKHRSKPQKNAMKKNNMKLQLKNKLISQFLLIFQYIINELLNLRNTNIQMVYCLSLAVNNQKQLILRISRKKKVLLLNSFKKQWQNFRNSFVEVLISSCTLSTPTIIRPKIKSKFHLF
eukprot:TRINITY_DN17142_c0_g1_i2.p1 TRINITY_DN17142_c0_g1~~TRINITY_DN17142_c0_g1_i2.p1  ORF type:complete len:296 (-),score=-9.02 TRINITY_DN17142_c0_g1_i2:362-1171(-)